MIVNARAVFFAAYAVAASTSQSVAQSASLHPPASLVASAGELHAVEALDELPVAILAGSFSLPGGGKASGWVLAAPGAAWNPTDVIVDASLPGRRMIVALCGASACALSYERGGIAHVYYVAGFARAGSSWKMQWLAWGNRPLATAAALRDLLHTRSASGFHDDPHPGRDF